jgi:hypothetical protein
MDKQEKKVDTHRVITMLDRDELEFLDKLGKDALFSTGHKLSYNEILKGLIDFAKDIGIKGDEAGSLTAFKKLMMQQIVSKLHDQNT